jgi:hypothetical protein
MVSALGGAQFFMPSMAEKQKFGISGPCIMMLGGGDQARVRKMRHSQGLNDEVPPFFLSCVS